MGIRLNFKVATPEVVEELRKLSTESLIIWIIGESAKKKLKLSIEDIALESWFINPDKHSLRGYPEYPDSFVVMKRIFDMKGRKGLIDGTTAGGFNLTQVSKLKFHDIEQQLKSKKARRVISKNATDRTITSIDEAPYKRLIRTPAYLKYKEGKLEQIVETDYLYFYGINWQSSKAAVEGKIRNVDSVILNFTDKDLMLKEVSDFLNTKFKQTKQSLTK